MTGPHKTPAQKQRNKYVAAVRARGGSGYNLWFVSPPLDPLTPHLMLSSDLEHECFLFLEGSPDLLGIDYAPLRAAGDKPRSGSRHFASATTIDGHRLEVDFAPEGSDSSPPGWRTITIRMLTAAKTRICSWRAVIAAINRCRSHELSPTIYRCRHLIEERPECTVGNLVDLVQEHPALVTGALATMLRSRELECDVHERLWGPETMLWARAHG